MAKQQPTTDRIRRFPKKITTTTAGFRVTMCEELAEKYGKKGPAKVLQVYGTISKTETDSNSFGDYTKFIGNHAAINLVDNVMYRSKNLILPEVAQTALMDLVAAHQAKGTNEPCAYGLFITIEYYEPKNPKSTKFTWGVEPVIRDDSADPLAALADQMGTPPMLLESK